jgi:RNA polymerase sigma-70 factor, ECF subfamily
MRDGSDDGSDDALMRRAGRGDNTAFAALVARHLPRATALAVRITGIRSDADEVVQEAFLRTWIKAPEWESQAEGKGSARFTTWFTRVLVNLCIDRRRRPQPLPIETAAEVPSTQREGFEQVSERETSARVLDALAQLPERQRAALTLCHWDGRSNLEAAEILEISVGALESLLVRARRSLRVALADLAPERSEFSDRPGTPASPLKSKTS